MMKVLVTGATGYIGSALCETLQARGHHPIGLARSPEKAAQLESSGVEPRLGDLEHLPSLTAACSGVDAVIHTAMRMDENAGPRDRAAVSTLLDALAGSRRPFIYTSGVWVMGDTHGRMLGEVTMLHPPPLVAWRPAVEELVIEAAERGVQSMVFRPGMVFGRNAGAVGGFFRDARTTGVVHFVGSGEHHWSNVHIDDLAGLYVLAVESPCPAELFIVTGGMPQPVRKIALAVAKACGIEGRVEAVPVEIACRQLGAMAACLAMDQKIGSTKAARFFGWTVRKPSIFDEIFEGSYTR